MLSYSCGREEYKNWIVEEVKFHRNYQGKCESIMALGNGYMGLRSALEEPYVGQTRNLFVAGTYNNFDEYEVTELPNAADVTELLIDINGEEFSLDRGKVLEYSRQLNLKDGELTREILWENSKGERYKLLFRRFVSLEDLHLIGMTVEITALTGSAEISFKTGINGRQTNSGVQHFHDGDKRVYHNKYMQLIQTTTHSKVHFAINSTIKLYRNQEAEETKPSYFLQRRSIYCALKTIASKGDTVALEKISNVFTSLDKDACKDLEELKELSLKHIIKRSQCSYYELLEGSRRKWREYWDNGKIEIESENDFDELAVRFAQYHLLIMTPFHDDRFSIGAKALTGEGYKGHVFWDTEIFILPYFQYTMPKVARKLLMYRYNTLEGARNKARKFGYAGAMYPWESALTGEEETPEWAAINILTGKATKVWSGIKEHHITADIAFAVWNYYLSTGDEEFMNSFGSEIIFECAEFWFRRLQWNKDKSRYEIRDVIGPDEYTEHIDNNAYTNYMAHYSIKTAVDLYERAEHRQWSNLKKIEKSLGLKDRINGYKGVLDRIYLPQPNEDRIIPQDDSFLNKPCIDLEKYKNSREKQVILKDYTRAQIIDMQILKQADVVMLIYLLRNSFDKEVKKANWHFYERRTIHDSSLSAAMHSIVANDFDDTETAYRFFKRAAEIDLGENPISSNDGIHAASLGGIWLAVVMGFGGIINNNGSLYIEPKLPKAWKRLVFSLYWQGERLNINIETSRLTISKSSCGALDLWIMGRKYTLIDEIIVYV